MMKSALIALAMMSSVLLAQQCGIVLSYILDTIQQQYNVYATVNETQEWDMRKYFFTGDNLKYSINGDCPYFETINPIYQIGDPVNHPDPSIGRIRSLKPLISFESGVWLNDFIFLEQNLTDVDVFFALGDPQQMDVVPEFRTQLNARNETHKLTCFDLDFISPTLIAVDCYQPDLEDEGHGYANGFITIDLADPTHYWLEANEHPTGYNYNYTAARKILFHNFTFTIGADGQEIKEGEPLTDGWRADVGQFLFRAEPAWATEHADLATNKLDDDCELEVYMFSNKKLTQAKPVAVFTKVELAALLKIDVSKVKFYLIDFQIEPNGDIYVLDAYNGVYVLRLSQSREWTLKNQFNPSFLANCVGFDFNYLLNTDGTYVNHLVLVYSTTANFYENGVFKFQIKLPRTATYENFQVQMSQRFIVFRFDTFVYLYHSDDGAFITTYNGDELDQLIINPYEPDLVAVNRASSHRFLISNGFLRLKKQDSVNDGSKSYSLVATKIDQPTNKCLVTLNVQVLRKTDITIHPSSSHPFPSTLTVPSEPISIDLIASGPNLQYSSLITMQDDRLGAGQVLLTIKSAWNLKLNDIKMMDAREVAYSDMLVLDNGSQFYLLLQKATKVVYIYQCTHKLSDHENAYCKDYTSFALNQVIDKSKHSFIWWINYGQIIYMYQDTDYSIQIYSCVDGKPKSVGTISEASPTADNKFTSVTMLTNAIYVVQEGLRVVKVYDTSLPFRQIYTIDNVVLAQFNVKGFFTPKRVFGNKKVKSQLVFIQSLEYLFVGEFANTNNLRSYVLLRQIPVIPGSTVEVAIGLTHFFVVQKLDDQDLIEEYNYQHIQRIYKTKDLPLFHYQLQKPLTVDSPSQTGWLFARASDGNETVVLVYEPGVVSHICLHKVLETKALDIDGKTFDMSVDGGSQMFAYFNNNTIHRVVSILQDAQLYVNPDVEGQQYVNDLLSQVQVTNFPGNAALTVSARIKVLNTQTDAIVKQQVFDNSQKVFKFVKQADPQTINMGTDWYTGQVTKFWITCVTCSPGDLSIISNINSIADGQDMKFDISDGVQFGTYGQVYQEWKSLIFQDPNGKFSSRLALNITAENCEIITVSDDASLIVSSWTRVQKGEQQAGVFLTTCTNGANCQKFRQGTFQLANAIKIAKLKLADKKNLIILNTDPENFGSFDNYIIISKLESDEASYTVSTVYTINDQFVGGVKLLQIGDFDVIKYQLNSISYNTILFTDINNGLYFAHFAFDAAGVFSKTTYELFDLKSNANEQYYVNSDTKFYQVRVISNQVVGTTLQLMVLITTSNTAHYVFYFELNGSQPTTGLPIIKASTSLQYILTPYGTWQTIDKLAYVNGHVAIPYSNEFKVVIGVYDLPSEKTSVVKTIPFGHAIEADYQKALPVDFALLLTKDTTAKYPFMYANINEDVKSSEYLVQKYELRNGPSIVLKNSTNYADNVPIVVFAMNDFTEGEGKAKLSINGVGPIPPDDGGSGSSNWWWITLLVILGVAILGVGGWFAYQKFGKSGVDPLLG